MSFQSYIDNIKAKTGLSPADFWERVEERGFMAQGSLKPEIKATMVTDLLKEDFGLGHGHGHAMAIYATIKGKTQ